MRKTVEYKGYQIIINVEINKYAAVDFDQYKHTAGLLVRDPTTNTEDQLFNNLTFATGDLENGIYNIEHRARIFIEEQISIKGSQAAQILSSLGFTTIS